MEIDSGSGSAGAINRVASGAYEMGFGDLNALVEFLLKTLMALAFKVSISFTTERPPRYSPVKRAGSKVPLI